MKPPDSYGVELVSRDEVLAGSDIVYPAPTAAAGDPPVDQCRKPWR